MEELWIGTINKYLVQSELDEIINNYHTNLLNVVKEVLDVRTFLMSITDDGSWTGKIYNDVARFWNETTSVEIYNIFSEYYKKYFASAKAISNVYSGLQVPTGTNVDKIALVDDSDTDFAIFKEKVKLTDEFTVNFKLGNIKQFYNTAHFSYVTNIPKQIEILNKFIEESFKDKSTSLTIFSAKLIEANNLLSQNLASKLQAFDEKLDDRIELLKKMEQTQIEDINKL